MHCVSVIGFFSSFGSWWLVAGGRPVLCVSQASGLEAAHTLTQATQCHR